MTIPHIQPKEGEVTRPETAELTKAQLQTLQEMATYDPYYSWRPTTAQQLVKMGLAVIVPERRPHMDTGRRITPAGRALLKALEQKATAP